MSLLSGDEALCLRDEHCIGTFGEKLLWCHLSIVALSKQYICLAYSIEPQSRTLVVIASLGFLCVALDASFFLLAQPLSKTSTPGQSQN